MTLYDWLKKRDKATADLTAREDVYFSLSPTRWSLYRQLKPLLEQNASGLCLDAGAGRMAFASIIIPLVDRYIALDLIPRDGLDLLGSALNLPFETNTFDTITCFQVLEHIPDPETALREFNRCLKPGGQLILSVPQMGYLHNEPHDYLRFTKHGLRAFLERAGFQVKECAPAGGLLSFLGHIPSMLVKALFFSIPIINRLVIQLNSWYAKSIVWVDERIEKRKLFALNVVAVAQKKGKGESHHD